MWQLIVGFFGFFWIIFLVLIIVKAVDIFLTGSGGDEVEEECEIELDEDGFPVEVDEDDEEACVPAEEEEEDERRLQQIDPTLRKLKLGPSLNISSLFDYDQQEVSKKGFKRFKKGKKRKAKKKHITKIYKVGELGNKKKRLKIQNSAKNKKSGVEKYKKKVKASKKKQDF